MPEDERDRFAVAAFQTAIEDEYISDEETQKELAALAGPLTPEELEDIGRALAEADAGLTRPADEFFAELRKKMGLRLRA
jgi:hypothetical protein